LNRLQVLPKRIQTDLPAGRPCVWQWHRHRCEAESRHQELHAYATLQEHTKYITFEPTCTRRACACASRRSGATTFRRSTRVGYDHNWVKQYVYDDDAAPLLPKGTIVHLIGFLDTTPANKNPAGPAKLGRRRPAVGRQHVSLATRCRSPKSSFGPMAKRRKNLKNRNDDFDIGCPLCWAPPPPAGRRRTNHGRGSRKVSNARKPSFRLKPPNDRRGLNGEPSLPGGDWLLALLQLSRCSNLPAPRPDSLTRGGQIVSPAYEGWRQNEDGSFSMLFGYMNANCCRSSMFDWPRQQHRAGGPDQGQPTHFYPRRQSVPVHDPRAEGSRQQRADLDPHDDGKTEHAYASLKNDYMIDNQVISTEVGGDGGSLRDELRTNLPPELKVEGDARRPPRWENR